MISDIPKIPVFGCSTQDSNLMLSQLCGELLFRLMTIMQPFGGSLALSVKRESIQFTWNRGPQSTLVNLGRQKIMKTNIHELTLIIATELNL